MAPWNRRFGARRCERRRPGCCAAFRAWAVSRRLRCWPTCRNSAPSTAARLRPWSGSQPSITTVASCAAGARFGGGRAQVRAVLYMCALVAARAIQCCECFTPGCWQPVRNPRSRLPPACANCSSRSMPSCCSSSGGILNSPATPSDFFHRASGRAWWRGNYLGICCYGLTLETVASRRIMVSPARMTSISKRRENCDACRVTAVITGYHLQ
jgi:hypothetical protein